MLYLQNYVKTWIKLSWYWHEPFEWFTNADKSLIGDNFSILKEDKNVILLFDEIHIQLYIVYKADNTEDNSSSAFTFNLVLF